MRFNTLCSLLASTLLAATAMAARTAPFISTAQLGTDTCIPPTIITQPADTQYICQGNEVALTVQADGTDLHYQWYQGPFPTGTDTSALIIGPMPMGNYEYRCIITNDCGGTATDILEIYIEPTPHPQIGFQDGMLVCFGPGSGYQWYLNGEPIPGANESTYTPTEPGTYKVAQVGGDCIGFSDEYVLGTTGIEEHSIQALRVLHALGTDVMVVTGVRSGEAIEVFDPTGARLLATQAQGTRTTINLTTVRSGVLLVRAGAQVVRLAR